MIYATYALARYFADQIYIDEMVLWAGAAVGSTIYASACIAAPLLGIPLKSGAGKISLAYNSIDQPHIIVATRIHSYTISLTFSSGSASTVPRNPVIVSAMHSEL